MILFISLLILFILGFLFRDYLFSFFLYLKKRAEGEKLDLTRLNSLRADLFHEGKKKFAGLEQILSSWSKEESTIKERLNYFNQLILQLRTLIEQQKENLLLSSEDIFIYAKLKRRVDGIESKVKRKRFDEVTVKKIGKDLKRLQEEIEKNIEDATKRFSFNFVDLVKDAVKTVRVEKRDTLEKQRIDIVEDYLEIKKQIRLPYFVYKDWLRVLVNLIRNGVETVESQVASFKSQVSKELSLDSEMRDMWVKVSVAQPNEKGLSVIIEDNGMGMDEKTLSDFYKRGYTKKDFGQGLGVTEESFELIHRYGRWEIESELGKGTKITIEIEKEKAEKERIEIEGKRTILQRAFPTPIRVVLVGLLLVIVGLGILFTVDKYTRFWEDWNPANFEAVENHLTIKNKSEKVLWDMFLPQSIRLAGREAKALVKLSDLNGDGKTEVLVAINHDARNTGKVICFNYKKEKLWEFSCGESAVYPIGEELNSGYFDPNLMAVEDLNGDSKKEVMVNCIHARWFPDQLAVLDQKGNKLSEYWHPGVMECLNCSDFDKDGEKEIILGGINNRMGWRPVLSVLSPKRVFGQAMPYLATKKLKKAKEKWYVVFPHIKKRLPDESEWEFFLPWVDDFEIFSDQNRIDIFLTDGRIYNLTLDFEFKYFYFQPTSFLAWKEARLFPYDLTEEDSLNWKNVEVWKEGVKIR